MGVFCAWVKLLTDLQILSCELRKNAGEGGLDLDIRPGVPRVPSHATDAAVPYTGERLSSL